MDNISSLRGITPEVASAPVHLFKVVPAVRQLQGGAGTGPSGAARNPPLGVMIEYYLARKPAGDLLLTFTDADGKSIRQFSSRSGNSPSPPAMAGMNRFLWDMRYPGTQLPPAAGALNDFQSVDHSPPSSPVAPPGRYLVRLSMDGLVQEQPFEIRKDPRVEAGDADFRAQFDLMVDIRDRVAEVTDVVMRIRAVRAQVEVRRAARPEVRVKAESVVEQLRDIEGTLMIWMGSESHPMMWGPPGLMEKFSTLSRALGAADARPTASMYALFEDLSERLKVQRNRLNKLVGEEVGPLLSH
jgi:hypothetical protein